MTRIYVISGDRIVADDDVLRGDIEYMKQVMSRHLLAIRGGSREQKGRGFAFFIDQEPHPHLRRGNRP
jgi:hypothetical protein